MKGIVVAFAFKQNYHVLRVTNNAGYSVHVLGKDCAAGLKYSRFCSSFQRFDFDPVSQSIEVALEGIRRAIAYLSADVILPSDVVSTRLLAVLADRLPILVYPLPDPPLFDLMNNKWAFYQFCKLHNIPVPESKFFCNIKDVKQALAQQAMKLPIIVKPSDAMGQQGVLPILSESSLPLLDTVDYKSIVVQEFIAGEWLGVDILADKGRIVAHAVQRNLADRYAFIPHEKLLAAITRIVELSGYHGAANFDAMQEAATGDIFLLECNPRFWYSIFAADLAGLNFVKAGFAMKSLDPMQPLSIANIDIFRMRTVVKKWRTLSKLNEWEARTSKYLTSDPVGILCSKLRRFDDAYARGSGSAEGQRAALTALGVGVNSAAG